MNDQPIEESSLTGLFDGTRQWRNGAGQLHRIGKPAIEDPATGSVHYFENGLRHRVGGPAIEWGDGTCEYWRGGARIDPATGKAAREQSITPPPGSTRYRPSNQSNPLPMPVPDLDRLTSVVLAFAGAVDRLLAGLRRRLLGNERHQ